MSRMLSYVDRPSPVHALCGATKFLFFLMWSILAMMTFDTRILLALVVLGLWLFRVSRTKFSEVSFILKLLLAFMALNLLAIYAFAPEQGVQIYGTRHVLWAGIGRYTLTAEQLLYEFNVFLKYCVVAPVAIVLMTTTHPTEFASSLHRIGMPYAVAYAISRTLRYIPDVQREYTDISRSQQARGLEMSKKVSLGKRLKGSAAILMPLVFSSLERIDTISHAMELRGFGKKKQRTWYSGRPFARRDFLVLGMAFACFALGLWITFEDGNRFWNPFLPQ
jgi:energy-coupling factor transport system permease protein